MMYDNNLVTVYITNYNYGAFIEEAIESVLAQSYPAIEVLVIDDGSTDQSHEVINQYIDHERINVIYQKNQGLTKTNNVALRLAKGKYIVRLDADDVFKADAIENLVKSFVDDKIAMVFGNWDVVDEHRNFIHSYKRHDFENDVTLMDCPAHGACTMFRTDYLRSVGGYDEDLRCQDGYELWFRIVEKFEIKSLSEIIFEYRRHGSNLTGNEEKILTTRSGILKKISANKDVNIRPFAFLPIRGSKLDSRSMPFETLGGKYIIDIVLEEVVKSQLFEKIVVSTPDERVITHILEFYSEVVEIDRRHASTAMINTGLDDVVKGFITNNDSFKELTHGVLFGIERPFNKKYLIESALDIAAIFGVDNVIGVRATNDIVFKHNGKTLKGVNFEKDGLRLERDELFQMVQGFNVFTVNNLFTSNSIWGSVIGHVAFDQKAAFTLNTNFDFKIGELFFNS
ncbi:hypothetical protein tloyanaT_29030 [Thalassotalea loyana]|uniref:Glycosyltransferase 2-like domain-containing protein n=1 Tax=Thalassotalea loyana TaxID=280483 RepID=A0ABQ6HIF9_9GAMM|nr:glycosyltransferase [Thalassotalea loyana]GLX86650.1 hypothetical protein tloyanaT_29030 [Thalassotalea loyana]